jgi:hypothetical protein
VFVGGIVDVQKSQTGRQTFRFFMVVKQHHIRPAVTVLIEEESGGVFESTNPSEQCNDQLNRRTTRRGSI